MWCVAMTIALFLHLFHLLPLISFISKWNQQSIRIESVATEHCSNKEAKLVEHVSGLCRCLRQCFARVWFDLKGKIYIAVKLTLKCYTSRTTRIEPKWAFKLPWYWIGCVFFEILFVFRCKRYIFYPWHFFVTNQFSLMSCDMMCEWRQFDLKVVKWSVLFLSLRRLVLISYIFLSI